MLIEIIQNTLNEYHQKLDLAHQNRNELTIESLNSIVKVDDQHAERSLNLLRKKLLPKLIEETKKTEDIANKIKTDAIKLACFLLPIFIISTLLTLRLISRLSSLSGEYLSILNMSPDAIIYSDESGKIIRSNQSACDMFGYTHKEFKKLTIEDLVPDSLRQSHHKYRENFSKTEQSRKMRSLGKEIQGKTKSGATINIDVAIAAKIVKGHVRAVCIVRDISDQVELKELAEKDPLTGIYNRRALDIIINNEITRSTRLDKELSLLIIDIDKFKSINDTFGHSIGDSVLKHVATHLQKHIRSYDYLARWGGDEFLILCPELNAIDATLFADRIRKQLVERDKDNAHAVTLSIGVATLDKQNHQPYQQLLEQADIALYQAKKNNRNQVVHANQC